MNLTKANMFYIKNVLFFTKSLFVDFIIFIKQKRAGKNFFLYKTVVKEFKDFSKILSFLCIKTNA